MLPDIVVRKGLQHDIYKLPISFVRYHVHSRCVSPPPFTEVGGADKDGWRLSEVQRLHIVFAESLMFVGLAVNWKILLFLAIASVNTSILNTEM